MPCSCAVLFPLFLGRSDWRCCAAEPHCGASQHPWSLARARAAGAALEHGVCVHGCSLALFLCTRAWFCFHHVALQHVHKANMARQTPAQIHACIYACAQAL